eukprot:504125-Amphidinium_carterae.2
MTIRLWPSQLCSAHCSRAVLVNLTSAYPTVSVKQHILKLHLSRFFQARLSHSKAALGRGTGAPIDWEAQSKPYPKGKGLEEQRVYSSSCEESQESSVHSQEHCKDAARRQSCEEWAALALYKYTLVRAHTSIGHFGVFVYNFPIVWLHHCLVLRWLRSLRHMSYMIGLRTTT